MSILGMASCVHYNRTVITYAMLSVSELYNLCVAMHVYVDTYIQTSVWLCISMEL